MESHNCTSHRDKLLGRQLLREEVSQHYIRVTSNELASLVWRFIMCLLKNVEVLHHHVALPSGLALAREVKEAPVVIFHHEEHLTDVDDVHGLEVGPYCWKSQ